MKHYLTNNEIRAIEDGQEFLVKADWVLLSDEELHARLNPPKTDEQILAEKVVEAQLLLDSTEFKFNVDYDQKDTPEWLSLKVKRQEAREFIRLNNVPNP